ncbi:MAG TPA: hypothetical protein VHQ90_15660 [Thermoanaerobaculia bacterium]|nr:hypothetical protein [Thermoanaerobaculia bacterium]
MRGHRPIVALLLAAIAAQRLAGAAPAAKCADPECRGPECVGLVTQSRPEVNGTMPGGPPRLLPNQEPVCLHMKVATLKEAGADIDIGKSHSGVHGVVRMFENSRLEFDRWVVGQVGLSEARFLAQLGNFQFYFVTPPRHAGKVQIVTPSGAILDLRGTYVCLEVRPEGTTVAVLEGLVIARSAAGGTVRLSRGSWTRIVPGKPPRPPSPLTGLMSPQAGGLTLPPLVVDPPYDLSRLQLPKAMRP